MHATPYEDKRGHDFEKNNGSVWEGCRKENGVWNYVIYYNLKTKGKCF